MVKTTIEKLMESINEAKDLYHSLVLLVGPSDIRKETAINEIAEKLDQQPINLNLELSKIGRASCRERV